VGHGLFSPPEPHWCACSQHEGRLAGVGSLGKKSITLDRKAFNQAHFVVLQHTNVLAPYVDEHMQHLRSKNPNWNDS
jgi:hypothetical protein